MPRPTQRRAWVWALASVAIRTFYRVDRTGEPLPEGALLLVANHPNTLIDPAVIQTTAGRQVRFLAKSTLFRGDPLSLLIRSSGAIPVYRRMDPGADTSRNAEMFSAVEAAFSDGESVCLFPEGVSHDRGRLEPLRTGAARMALASTTRDIRSPSCRSVSTSSGWRASARVSPPYSADRSAAMTWCGCMGKTSLVPSTISPTE